MKKTRRIIALIGVILLAAMYLATLFFAIFDSSHGMVMFKFSVLCTVLVPVLLWGYTVIYRLAKGKEEQELQETLQNLKKQKEKESQKNS